MMDHRSIVIDTRQGNVESFGHTQQEPQRVARAIVEDLLSEQPTYGFLPEQAGPYAHGLRILERVRRHNGREPARRTFSDLQTNEALFRDLLANPSQVRTETRSDYPELPAHVKANQSLAQSASPLLDALIAFFQQWCTRSYEGYHEAVAIWVLSTIAARRVVLRWRTGVWPILYLLLVSESTAHAKTEAASYGALVLEQAGLDHLLNPGDFSPQKLLLNMAGNRLPRNYSCMTDEQKEAIRRKMGYRYVSCHQPQSN
jgi:hypothetical protein